MPPLRRKSRQSRQPPKAEVTAPTKAEKEAPKPAAPKAAAPSKPAAPAPKAEAPKQKQPARPKAQIERRTVDTRTPQVNVGKYDEKFDMLAQTSNRVRGDGGAGEEAED